MTTTLHKNADGTFSDDIVEILFRDLYEGTYTQALKLCADNFNIYMLNLFHVETEVKDFEEEDMFEALIENVFGEHLSECVKVRGDKFRIEYKAWEGKIAVEHSEKHIALALSIVQHARYAISTRFRGTRH